MASLLPDELWSRIMEVGIQSSTLTNRDLCSLAISCRRFNRLSSDPSLWSSLLSSDFPEPQSGSRQSSSSSFSTKNNYRIRYEKEREQKLLEQLALKRALLRVESDITQHLRKISQLELQYSEEKQKARNAVAELSNLHKIRQASVALNVWQPRIVQGKQKQIVEQCDVPVESRIHALEMELKLCKQQIAGYDKSIRAEKRKLNAAEEQAARLKYHPLQDSNFKGDFVKEGHIRRKRQKHALG